MDKGRRVICCLVIALVAVLMLAAPVLAADGLGEFAGGDSNDVWLAILIFSGIMIAILYFWFYFWKE